MMMKQHLRGKFRENLTNTYKDLSCPCQVSYRTWIFANWPFSATFYCACAEMAIILVPISWSVTALWCPSISGLRQPKRNRLASTLQTTLSKRRPICLRRQIAFYLWPWPWPWPLTLNTFFSNSHSYMIICGQFHHCNPPPTTAIMSRNGRNFPDLAIRPWPLTSDCENLSSNAHLHDEYLYFHWNPSCVTRNRQWRHKHDLRFSITIVDYNAE